MSTSHAEQFEHLLAQYREQHDTLVESQRRLAEIDCTATAPRRTVTVTAGHGGVIKDIKFPTGAYKRMAPAELAAVVLDAITEAQEQATAEAVAVMAPSLPAGLNATELFSGRADLRSLLPAAPQLSEVVRDVMKIED